MQQHHLPKTRVFWLEMSVQRTRATGDSEGTEEDSVEAGNEKEMGLIERLLVRREAEDQSWEALQAHFGRRMSLGRILGNSLTFRFGFSELRLFLPSVACFGYSNNNHRLILKRATNSS